MMRRPSRKARLSVYLAAGGVLAVVLPVRSLVAFAYQLGPTPYFTDAQRLSILTYWNMPGRYQVEARLDASPGGPFVVRLTPEASTWFANYNRAVKTLSPAPGADPAAPNPTATQWEAWVSAKLQSDRGLAQVQADAANAAFKLGAAPPPEPTAATPAMMPASLLAAVGNAPPLAACVIQHSYVVAFGTGEVIRYNDYLAPKNQRYAYFRFGQGVSASGTALSKLAPDVLDQIFATGNMTPSEARVMKAVSLLEGGFDSINTYDTGYVSVGFIQFAALQDGANSLGDLLLYEKRNAPAAFTEDFQALGVDVTEKGVLVVVDPSTGAELQGKDAALKIIEDKRLTAVFHLAGMRSVPFRSAQLYVAKNTYYPADLDVTVNLSDRVLTGKVRDVIHSEAGMATLFDRKVNTGNIRLLNDVLSQSMAKYKLTGLDQLQPHEREVVTAMKWRHDYLQDPTLSQPAQQNLQ